MQVNRMWAMFDGEILFRWTIRETRTEVIELVEKKYGMKWQHIYRRIGYRIEKVVVLRADDFEAQIKAAREEVLKLAKKAYDEFPDQRTYSGNLNFLEYLDWLYKDRSGE